jgi:DNA-binding NtrC family response regulator
MASVMDLVDRYAGSSLGLPILLTGEPGTGKTFLARRIYERSYPDVAQSRRAAPFVAVNTAEIQAEQAVSYLFGHSRGAFTGASGDRTGALEQANGGILFIDELSNLGPDAQRLLLTSLLTGRFRRMGDGREITVRARFVGATNEDPATLVATGRLRRDLYDRLGFMRVHIPPLRERREEVLPLARHYLNWAARADGLGRHYLLTREAEQLVLQYSWPGNLRELWLACATATVHADGELIESAHFPVSRTRDAGGATVLSEGTLAEALRQTAGNKTRTAELLGVLVARQPARIERPRSPRSCMTISYALPRSGYRTGQRAVLRRPCFRHGMSGDWQSV